MPFRFAHLDLPDVVHIQPQVFPDERGHFLETYKWSEFVAWGIPQTFRQTNQSFSTYGVLRGLHYQKPPASQAKLVSVAVGEIFDVAVDIRKRSPTYGRWVGRILSGRGHNMLFVPEGFAHGFCVLSAAATVTYMVTSEYSPEHDAGIIWNDPSVGIEWPIVRPILSDKDARLPTLDMFNSPFSSDT